MVMKATIRKLVTTSVLVMVEVLFGTDTQERLLSTAVRDIVTTWLLVSVSIMVLRIMTVSCTRIVPFLMDIPSILELDHVVTDGQLPMDSRLVTADMEEVGGTDVMSKPLGTSISVKASAPVMVEDLCSEDSYLARPICSDAQSPATTELTVSDSIME